MLELLQARGRMGGPELARRLEVGERTVRRYVAMLQEMGVPVEAERGRYGAYVLRPGFKLPPMMFTDEEALALPWGCSRPGIGLSGAARLSRAPRPSWSASCPRVCAIGSEPSRRSSSRDRRARGPTVGRSS